MSQMSDLDRKLQDLALKNWEEFCLLASVDKRQAIVCMMRKEGKSLGQIAQRLGMAKTTVWNISSKCVPQPGTDSSTQ